MSEKSQFMPIAISLIVTWFVMSVGLCFAQITSVDSMNRALVEDARFSPDDLQALKKGVLMTKLLQENDKREVAVFGIARIEAPIEIVENSFKSAIRKQEKKTSLQSGTFGASSRYDDIGKLQIERKDLAALKKCKIRDCDVRLSASMIELFSSEIDWARDDRDSEAEDLYRTVLANYVSEYLQIGDEALIEYESKNKTLRLKDELESLNKNLLWLNRIAPELNGYLKEFPHSRDETVVNSFRWSKINFGLKPVVIISHTATYNKQFMDASQIIIVSKQIYSSRYIDSSLSLTAIISFPIKNARFETYIVFANHTRASALGSRFGSLARNLVEEEALGKVKDILADTRQGAVLSIANQQKTPEIYQPADTWDWFHQNVNIIFLVAILILVLVALNWHRRR